MLSDPIAVLSKYPIGPSDPELFSPSVVIYYGDNEELLLHESFSEYVRAGVEGWKLVFTDFEVLEPPAAMTISSCEAMRFKARFLFEHEDISPTRVNMESLILIQEEGQYTIHLFDSPYTGEIAEEEFSAFISTLHVV